MEFHSPGKLHVVVSSRSSGARLQRFAVCAFREYLLGCQRVGYEGGDAGEGGGNSKHAVQVATKDGRMLVNGTPRQGRHALEAGLTRPSANLNAVTCCLMLRI
jgi:hypothetical protein